MIRLTRLNGAEFVLNAELIQEIEAKPDTIVTLTNGQKLMVREPVDAVRRAYIEYRREISKGPAAGAD
jgi:flagellar protein FlbD